MTTPARPSPTTTTSSDSSSTAQAREAHTHEGDAIAAARRRLPMTEVPPDATVVGPDGPVLFGDVFEGRDELVVHSHMFYDGEPWEWQCEGCTRNSWPMQDAADAAGLNAYGITFAILGNGPYEEIAAFRDFMGYTTPWYPTPTSTTPPSATKAGSPAICGGGQDLPDVLDDRQGRRGDESLVRAARQGRLRAAGGDLGVIGVAFLEPPIDLCDPALEVVDRLGRGGDVASPGLGDSGALQERRPRPR